MRPDVALALVAMQVLVLLAVGRRVPIGRVLTRWQRRLVERVLDALGVAPPLSLTWRCHPGAHRVSRVSHVARYVTSSAGDTHAVRPVVEGDGAQVRA